MDEGGTYLEDFLLSLEMLPNDVRRDFELVRFLLLLLHFSLQMTGCVPYFFR